MSVLLAVLLPLEVVPDQHRAEFAEACRRILERGEDRVALLGRERDERSSELQTMRDRRCGFGRVRVVVCEEGGDEAAGVFLGHGNVEEPQHGRQLTGASS